MGQSQTSRVARRDGWLRLTTPTRARLSLVGLLTLAALVGVRDRVGAQELGDAIDISNGTGEITVDDVRCWVESNGVRHILVKAAIDEEWSGTNHNRDTSRQQLETLWRAKYEEGLDFSVDIYLYVHWPPNLNFSTPVPDQVREAIDLPGELAIGFPPLPVGRLWIDLEEAPPTDDPPTDEQVATTVSLIRDAFNECGLFPCGIYTRKDWWETYTRNTTDFSTYPLWYARYSCPPNPTFSDFEPFGGWTAPFGKQYDDGRCLPYLCGPPNDFDIMYLSPKRADLEVSGISFTSSPKPGVQTTAVAKLTNIGELASSGFNVEWFLDGDQVGYGGHSSLAPGEVSSGNVRFIWTPSPGVHTLRFVADVDNHVQEPDETNNSDQVTINVPAYADLEVSGISFTSSPKPGVQTTAVAKLTNIGEAASSGFNVKWFLDGAQVGYGYHSSLGPDEVSSGNVRFIWTPSPGVHTLRFEADADNHVTESNENNNGYQVTFTVLGLPDLQVSGITLSPYPKVGVTTTATAHLANLGQSASGGFNVKWFLNGVQVGYGYHTPLAAGQVSTNNVRFTWNPSPGTYTLRFEADVDKHVAESNENNNGYQVTVTVTY